MISTCDRAASLATLLDALRRQTYAEFETLVVKGPCEDETAALLQARSGELRALDCPVRNLSMARNVGIDASAGDVVAFIDDDGIPEPRWLEDLARAYEDEQVGGAGGLTLDPSGTRPQYRYSVCSRIGITDFDQEPPLDRFNHRNADPFLYLQGTNCSFRRHVLEAVEGFDEEIEYNYDESEVCSRVLDSGFELRALETAVVHHKFLTSAMRTEAGFTDPFLPMKNRAYFALRLGRDFSSRATIMTSLTSYLQEIIDWTHDVQRRGLFSQSDVEFFVQRAEQGFALGIERGLSGERKGRHILPARREDFLPYPALRPGHGRRLCVCFVSIDQPPKPVAGIARFTNDLAHGFAAQGHEVHMVTRDDDRAPRMDYEHGVWVHRFPVGGRWVPGLQNHPVAGLLHHLAAVHNAVQAVADRAPVDVVSGSLWIAEPLLCALNPSWVTAVACNKPTRKIAQLKPETATASITPWQIALEDALLRSPAHLQPVSHTNADFLLGTPGLAGRPYEVIWHGVKDIRREFPRQRQPDGAVQVLFVGRLEPRKGIDTLLEAVLPILEVNPQVSVRIVGADNPHANGREKFWQDWLRASLPREVADRQPIVFEGQIEDAALFQAYADCDIFCAPSRYESFGLVHVEAMMFGRPVVASRSGGMQETVIDGVTGVLVEPGDSRGLRNALAELVADEGLRHKLGDAGRHRYETEFRNEIAVQRNARFYERISHSYRAPSPEAAHGETLRRTAEMLAEVFALSDADAEAAADALLDRERFPVDYEYGVRTLVEVADDESFVRGLYRLILGRDPEPDVSAAAFYNDELMTGDRMAVVRTIVNSAEARGKGVNSAFLANLPPVQMKPLALPRAVEPPRRAVRARLRRRIRRARDIATGVNAHRVALAGTEARLLEANSHVARLVQQELTSELNRTETRLNTELAIEVDRIRSSLERTRQSIYDVQSALRQQVDVMARKQEALAIDVREKIPDIVFDDLPEPLIVDRDEYERKIDELGGLRLNLGCGEKPLSGYVNVDMRHLPGVDVIADIRRLPFSAGSISEIASAHLVEHFRQHHLEMVILPYWRTLLAPDGLLRIVCPNWDVLIDQYKEKRLTLDQLKQVTFGLQDYSGDDHFAMYSPQTLKRVLVSAGFESIEVLEERRQNGLSPEMEVIARVAPRDDDLQSESGTHRPVSRVGDHERAS